MFCFAPAYELCQGVLKVNSSIAGILLDPFWRKAPKYIRRAQMYLGSAESFEEGFTGRHPLPFPPSVPAGPGFLRIPAQVRILLHLG